MEDDALLLRGSKAPPASTTSATHHPSSTTSMGKGKGKGKGEGWWRRKRAYEEIIDDEEVFWTELSRVRVRVCV